MRGSRTLATMVVLVASLAGPPSAQASDPPDLPNPLVFNLAITTTEEHASCADGHQQFSVITLYTLTFVRDGPTTLSPPSPFSRTLVSSHHLKHTEAHRLHCGLPAKVRAQRRTIHRLRATINHLHRHPAKTHRA